MNNLLHRNGLYQWYNKYQASSLDDALLSRQELTALTGTKQARRMCDWLGARGWVFEPPARRGDIPKVLRAYRDARLSGLHRPGARRGDYSFMWGDLS